MAKHSYDEYISAFREGTSGGADGRNSTSGTAAVIRSYNDYVSAFRAGAGIGYKSKQEAAVQPELKPQEVKLETQIQGIRQQSQRIDPNGGQNQAQDIQTIRSKVQKLPQRQSQRQPQNVQPSEQPAGHQTGAKEAANAYDETGIRADTQAYKNPKTLSAMAANGDEKASELMRRRYQSLEKEYGNADSGRAQRESREKRMKELDAQLAVVQQNIQNVTRTVTGPLPDTEEGRKTANQLRAWNMQRDRLLAEKQALSQQEDVKTGVYAAQEEADSAMKSYKKAAMEYQSSKTTVMNIANGLVGMYKGSGLYDALVEAQKQDEDEAEKNGTTPTYDRLFTLLEQEGMTPEYIDRISGQWASMPYSQALSEAQEREKALSTQEKTLRTSAQRESDAWEYEVAKAYSDKDFAALSKPSEDAMPDGMLGEAYNVLMQSKDSILQQGADFFDTEVEIGGKTLTWQELTEMSDEEKKLFFYYCNTGNEDMAALWLASNADALKYRRGETIAELADYPVLREIAALGSSAERGAKLVGYGIGSLFADIDAPDVTSDEYALASLSRRNKGTVAGFAIGAAQNIGNMAPSLAGYAIHPAVGLSATFLNARGNAYVEAKRDGFTHGQAWIYSTLVGASEAGLEKVLGGMGGIAKGAVPQKVLNMFGEPKKLVWKLVRDYGVHASSELIEENLQNYLEPAFKMIAGMEDQYDTPGAEEFIETSVVTAITTLFFSAAQAPAKVRQEKINQTAGRWADAALRLGEDNPAYEEAVKLRELLDNGENVSQEQILGAFERAGDLDEILKTQAQQVQQQTQERAAQVQEQNPDATVVRSAGAQAYLDSGKATLAVAQKAGEVLDRIVSGEITSGTVTSSQIDALLVKHEYGRTVVSEVIGVEVRRAANASQQRQAVRDAIRAYEAQREATMSRSAADTSEQGRVATRENAPTSNVQENAVQFDGQQDSAAEARTGAQTQAVSEAAPVPSQETRQVAQPERQAGVMKYGSFKYRFQNDKGFRSRYAQGKSGQSDASRTLTAYENYKRMMREALDTGEVLTRDAFGRVYSEMNDTKKLKSSDAEIDLAYQEYLNERRDAQQQDTETQTEQTEQTSQTAHTVGLFENEFSASVPQEVRTAVDALARELGLRVRYADLGNDNGYYNTKTGEVVLDVNPARRSVDEAGRSAYLFTVAHEVGHYAKQRMSKTSWASFERHAISALGGDAALDAKRGEVDENGERVYETEDDVREDVACDFIGQVMSSGKALDEFVAAIRENKVSTASANGILRAIKRALGKLTGKNKGISEGLKLFSEDIAAGQKAVDEITKALSEVAKNVDNTNHTKDTDIRRSRKDDAQSSEEYKNPINERDIEILRSIGRKSINEFSSEDIQKTKKWAYKFYQELGVKSPFFRAWFGDWRANDTSRHNVVVSSNKMYKSAGKAVNNDTGRQISWGDTVVKETKAHAVKGKESVIALGDIEDIVKNAVLLDTVVSELSSKSKMKNTAFMHSFYVIYNRDGNQTLLKLFVEEALPNNGGDPFSRAYQLKDIEKIADLPNGVLSENGGLTDGKTTIFNTSISELFSFVKRFDHTFKGKPANSLFINEDGTPKLFYHGSKKNGGFTVFRDWQYFTEQKRYAERYAERGNDKSLYEVYLTADKVFDTRDDDAAKVFESIRQEYGLGELQDTGLPDWTDGYDITEYLSEHPELGYDAVLLDEGGDLVNGEPVSRGLSIVIKDSGQVKSAKDNIGAFDRNNPDIRRSRKDTSRRVIPTPEQAQALEEKRKAREAEQEAERIRRRDEFMRNFVRSAPGVAKHLNRAAMDTEIRRSRKDQRIEGLVAKHGAIPTGENPVRDVSVPNRTTEDTRVRRTVRTAMEAGVTPEALTPKIEESIVEGNFNYNPKKNAETMEAARDWVERRKTVDDAYKDWLSAKKNHLNADMIARGFIIYNNYANAAETVKSEAERVRLQQNAVSILQDISVMGTVAGQTAQAMRLLKQQTPGSQYYALERAVQKLQDGINDRYGGKKADAPKIEIDKKLAGKWLQALREGDMELAYDLEAVLFQNIASQIPKTLGDRLNAWRYLSMLGNPKTLIRNAVGNAAFTPVVMLKDKIGAAMELSLKKEKRTKYLGLLHASEEGRALLKFASEDGQSADVLQLMERNKYDDTSLNDRLARYVQERKRTFTAPVLKQWQAATRYMMEKAPFMGDEFYKNVHYRRAFAGAAMARGYTVSDLTSGKASETELMELRVYAANQAMKATFNDANKVSDLVSRARFKNKVANTALEGTLPFKRTPANVAVRSFEYSPAGLLKALSTDIYALKTGKITGQEYIERLSQGVTGSVMFGLGWLAAELGIVRVNADDDDEREGRQSYSLEVFGKSVTLDWLVPTSVAFFMGSETQELLSGWGEDQSFLDAMLDSTSNLFAPVLEITALSGAKDLLDTFVYSYKKDGADVGQITMALFVQPFLSYLGQYVPTIFGQGENLFEPYRTTTYVGDIEGKVERVFVRNFAKILEKVPFVDWRQIEYVDDWGRKDYNGDIPFRFFNSFINPAYVNDIVPTEVDAEVRRIKETTGKNVSPTKRGYKITVSEYDEDGEKLGSREVVLSAEQYRDYQMEYGTQYALMASALMASEYYDTLSDSEKAKAFKEIESLADEYGKLAANVGYMIDPGSTDNKLYELVQMGMPAAEAYSARLMYTQINNDDEMKPVERYEQFRVWVYGNDAWTEEEKQAVIDRFGKFSSGFVVGSENFDEMLKLGIDADKAMSINDGIRNLKPEDGLVDVSQSQKYGYILSRSDLNTEEKNAAIKSYMSSNETNAFAPCEAAGITATEYAEVALKIGTLEPIGENKGVTAAQKYEVCVQSFSSEAKQDAMLRRYMSAETEAKYDTLRDSGVSPATYVAWYSAKYTYGDGNGSWKQDELEKWLRENVSSRAQRAALWEATNAGWKNNPFK